MARSRLLLSVLVNFLAFAQAIKYHALPKGARPNYPTRIQRYQSEPGVDAVVFSIIREPEDRSLLAPGLLFMTIAEGHSSSGPQIYDMDGELVWHGVYEHAQNLIPCDYLGQQGHHVSVHILGTEASSVILDPSYHAVSLQRYASDNAHEFYVLPGGRTALHFHNRVSSRDLRPYISRKDGWTHDTCLEELDVATGDQIFLWCYLDWLPIWDSTFYPLEDTASARKFNASIRGVKAGKGTKTDPWDFIHANALDKYDGDYIMSARHLDQIIKIAGPENRHGVKPGTVLWRLGGRRSDFEQDFTFSRQHHVRFVSVDGNETVISFFNNAWDGELKPWQNVSSGLIVRLNNATMKASLVARYAHPDGVISEGRGSTQLLPNGNVLVGFGRFPDMIEYSAAGEVLWHTRYSGFQVSSDPNISYRSLEFSYRVIKDANWSGRPPHPPKLLVYSHKCDITSKSPLIGYVSWNGATDVKAWRFYVSTRIDRAGPWLHVGDFPKTGFETKVHLSSMLEAKLLGFTPYVRVQGIDAGDAILDEAFAETWVPNSGVKGVCDANGCLHHNETAPFWYREQDRLICPKGRNVSPFVALVLFLCFVESVTYLLMRLLTIEGLPKMRIPRRVRFKAKESPSTSLHSPPDSVSSVPHSPRGEHASLVRSRATSDAERGSV